MIADTTKYLNPFTDFGFKKIFGEESNKDLLIDFLNSLLKGKEKIKNLNFKNSEQLPNTNTERSAIFDLYCENDKGERFIIELQKDKQQFFKERALYYATFPIQEQVKKGKEDKKSYDWSFNLKAVYLIGILDFTFDEDKNSTEYKHSIKLMDEETHEIFYDKLSFIYLEMPKFNKKENELKNNFDKWMYVLKYLPSFQNRPKILKNIIFEKLFKISELAQMTHKEYMSYEHSLKRYWDLNNVINTAKYESIEKGRKEGMEKGMEKGMEMGIIAGIKKEKEENRKKQLLSAIDMKKNNLPIEKISQYTGLSIDEINN
jgi:predicted transposase/invertase (TIGR01784 family)